MEKKTLKSSVYKLFYNVIKDNYNNPTSQSHFIYPSYPLDKLAEINSYPMIVIESPDFVETGHTLDEREYLGTIDITFLSISKKTLDEMSSEIHSIIDDEVDKTFTFNKVEDVNLDSESYSPFEHGEVKGHSNTMTFSFKVFLSKIGS